MMNKRSLLAVAAAALMVCGNAQAEFLIGGQGGFAEADGEYRLHGASVLTGEESGGAFGVFSQYRFKVSDGVAFGVHFGWAGDSTEWQYGELGFADNTGTYYYDSLSLAFEVSNTIDLLGLIVFPGEQIKPLAMFGYSSVDVERTLKAAGNVISDNTPITINETDSATLSGWKVVAGAEFPFGENWLGHVLLHYADYGDEEIGPIGESVEVTQTGVRFGVAYSF